MVTVAAIWLSLTSYIFTAPATIQLTFHVAEPGRYRGKQLCFYISDGIPTGSCYPYFGNYIYQTQVKNVPEGDYEAWAELGGEVSPRIKFIVR